MVQLHSCVPAIGSNFCRMSPPSASNNWLQRVTCSSLGRDAATVVVVVVVISSLLSGSVAVSSYASPGHTLSQLTSCIESSVTHNVNTRK